MARASKVIHDFGKVRVMDSGQDPTQVSSDILVQELMDGDWVYVCGFNSLSDDYAYTNAREAAERHNRSLAAPSRI